MTLWTRTSPYQHLYDHLWPRLVPAEGAAATPHGQFLRAAGRLYYARHSTGFGAGSLSREWDVIRQFRGELAPHAGADFTAVEAALSRIRFGADSVGAHWSADAALERLTVSVLVAVKRMSMLAGPPLFIGINHLVAALSERDPDLRMLAVRFADKMVADQPGWLDDNALIKVRRALRAASPSLAPGHLSPRTEYLLSAAADEPDVPAPASAPAAVTPAPRPDPAAERWHWDEQKKKDLRAAEMRLEESRLALAREAEMAEELRNKLVLKLRAGVRRRRAPVRRFFPRPSPGGTYNAMSLTTFSAGASDDGLDSLALSDLVDLAMRDAAGA